METKYKDASNNQKKVIVAKEALHLLRNNINIQMSPRTYLSLDLVMKELRNNKELRVRSLLNEDAFHCETCALGILFLSEIKNSKSTLFDLYEDLDNNYWFDEFIIRRSPFSDIELKMIESVFEESVFEEKNCKIKLKKPFSFEKILYLKTYRKNNFIANDKKFMIYLLKGIVENEGDVEKFLFKDYSEREKNIEM